MSGFFQDFARQFSLNFIEGDRWKIILNGLLVTLQITFFAVIIGIVLGFAVGLVRAANERAGKLRFLSGICRVYVTVIRGTPVMVQLLIIYFVVFMSVSVDKKFAAILAFGINSGAYVSEIFRSGILSVDIGQTEAGRSLGLTGAQTMRRIVLPQAVKNALPALGNEFISLLKETSVVGYIGLVDLTKSYAIIQSRTYSAFFPLMAIALIYLLLVLGLTKLLGLLERRLRASDKH